VNALAGEAAQKLSTDGFARIFLLDKIAEKYGFAGHFYRGMAWPRARRRPGRGVL
jgi:hypothetical protein